MSKTAELIDERRKLIHKLVRMASDCEAVRLESQRLLDDIDVEREERRPVRSMDDLNQKAGPRNRRRVNENGEAALQGSQPSTRR